MIAPIITTLILLSKLGAVNPSATPQGGGIDQKPPTPQELAEIKRLKVDKREQAAWLAIRRAGVEPFNREAFLQKRLSQIIATLPAGKTSTTLCPNGDFESGSFSNWGGGTGVTKNKNWNSTTWSPGIHDDVNPGGWGFYAPNVAQHAIVGPHAGAAWNTWNNGTDPFVTARGGTLSVPFQNGGTKTFRLGNPNLGGSNEWAYCEDAYLSFVPSAASNRISFRYALVEEDPGQSHTPQQKPQFQFVLIDVSSGFNSFIVTAFTSVADASSPFYQKLNGGWVMRRTSCFSFEIPPARFGHTLIAYFVNFDCSLAGHGGYTYIDDVCSDTVGKPVLTTTKTNYCDNEPIMVDGSQTDGELAHTWRFEQCSATGVPVPGTAVSETKQTQVGGPFNIVAWYKSKGKQLVCGKYYKVSLSADSECVTGQTTDKIIFIDCCGQLNCECTHIDIQKADLRPTAAKSNFGFSPTILVGGIWKACDLTIVNVYRADAPNFVNKPIYSFFFNPGSAPGFSTGVPTANPYSHVVRWLSTNPGGSPIPMISFPSYLSFQPPATTGVSYLAYTVKYSFIAADCKVCEKIVKYYYKFVPGQTGGIPISAAQWPKQPTGDPGDPPPPPDTIWRNEGAGERLTLAAEVGSRLGGQLDREVAR